MKKWIIALLLGILMIVIFIYVFIPNKIDFREAAGVRATSAAVHRLLLNKNNVSAWWPGKTSNDSLYLDGFSYEINDGNITVVSVSMNGKNTRLTSSLFITEISVDSTQLQWVGMLNATYHPVKRLYAYLDSKKISRNMTTILQKMEQFYSTPKNIYGIEIKQTLVVDSLLISTDASTNGYPTNEIIYGLVNKLRSYAATRGAKQQGYPMLNVITSDSLVFTIKVAIPTNIALPSSGDILYKKMPGRTIILVARVKGGVGTTTLALEQMSLYANDHNLKVPAIPFYSLVTDRLQQPDSSNWITDIYFPASL